MKHLIELLNKQDTVTFRPRGNSMQPIIKSGQECTILKISKHKNELKENDIVFCKVKGNFYLHKISAIRNINGNNQYQISNNKGFINGWISDDKIFAVLTKIKNS